MSKLECHIVEDLLSLYIDGVCGEQTANDVSEHLASCESCKKLYKKMTADADAIDAQMRVHARDAKHSFRRARNTILVVIFLIAVEIVCFAVNCIGAFIGDQAGVGNLIVTIAYIAFWCAFTYISRKYLPLVKISLAVSLVTFISSAACLLFSIWQNVGFIVAIILSLFGSVPFYGFRYFMGWTPTYAVASAISALWLAAALYLKQKLKRSLKENPHPEDDKL